MKLNKIYNEDCLKGMKRIPDKSIDMILCDLPYGTTACSWDVIIPFDELWRQYKRIIKDAGVIALTASQPFSSQLIMSNIEMFKYNFIWEKNQGSNFLTAKRQPLKIHEDILIFYDDPTTAMGKTTSLDDVRNYLLEQKRLSGITNNEIYEILGNHMRSHYFTKGSQFKVPPKKDYLKLQTTGFFQRNYEELTNNATIKLTYNPQMTVGTKYKSGKGTSGDVTGNVVKKQTINDGSRYPTSILKFNRETGLHPTQKPVALFEYLIQTYTNEGDVVLDNCIGSGTTAVAAINTNRQFIGFEKEKEYFDIAIERIEEILGRNK